MGCGSTTEEEHSSQSAVSHKEPQIDLSGYGLPMNLRRRPSEQEGLRITVLVSINNGPEHPLQIGENERAVWLKMRIFDEEKTAAPPCVTQLEFSGTTIEDADTFAQHGVCDDALLQLTSEPSQLSVKLYGMITFGTEKPSAAVWGAEPAEAMLTRLAKRYFQEPGRLLKFLKQRWYMHVDAGCFSKPVSVNMNGTVQQANILDGASLIPGSHLESFELAQKEKYVHVGMTMKYYGDLVQVKEITGESGALSRQYIIGHDNQDKRTILKKLDFVD